MKCVRCGGDVFGNKCFRPKCIEYWQNYWENKVQEKITDYQSQIQSLNSYETSTLKLEDYQELKKIEKETKNWEKKLESSPVKSEVSELLQKITDLENKFPEKIRIKYKNKGKTCHRHRNICWDGFFEKEKNEKPYCLDCGEDENPNFTKSFQRWYRERVKEWTEWNKLKYFLFPKFLRKNNSVLYDFWNNLTNEKLVENIKDDFIIFQEFNKGIEEILLEFAEEQEKKDNPNKDQQRERERERERRKLQRRIKNLEKKPNRTPEEETELLDLKDKLKKLDKEQNYSSPNSYTPWIISGACLIVFLFLIFITFRKSKKK